MTIDHVISLAQVASLLFFAGRLTERVSSQGADIKELKSWKEKTESEFLPLMAEHRIFHHSGE